MKPAGGTGAPGAPVLGLRANLAQFSLLVGVNALVGGMLGQERTVLPLLANQVFHLTAYTAALTFIVAFGATKALTNLAAGALCDRYGRKPVLVAGWLIAVPVPVLLITAPTWAWILAANVLLGISQGLSWSSTVIMKIDLAGPAQRGLAMGLNEAAGYGAVALSALGTGLIAAHAGLRPEPFYLGLVFAGLGLGLSGLLVRETRDHAHHEAGDHQPIGNSPHRPSTRDIVALTSVRDRSLSAACQAGLVNNLNDGLAWGLFPLLFAQHGVTLAGIGTLAALYPAVWGAGQLVTGWWSDRAGRKRLIVAGMWLQALALALVALATSFAPWALAALLLGSGTALVYPTLLAVVGDLAHPTWRATAVGVYRFWRDAGFALGAILAGILADIYGITTAIWAVALLTAASGALVATRMRETAPRQSDSAGLHTPGAFGPPDSVGFTRLSRWRRELLALRSRPTSRASVTRPCSSPTRAPRPVVPSPSSIGTSATGPPPTATQQQSSSDRQNCLPSRAAIHPDPHSLPPRYDSGSI